MRGCNGTLSQRWTVAADGTLRVSGTCVNVNSGQCLTGPADGNRVRVAACGTGGQAWALP